MKRILLAFCVIALLVACDKDNTKTDMVYEVILTVNSQTSEYTPWGSEQSQEGLLIKEPADQIWTVIPMGSIEGFDYQNGYEYSIRVLKTILANPAMDDSNVTYKLLEIIQQKQISLNLAFQPHNGEIAQLGSMALTDQHIGGMGYDIMARYCASNSTKERVIDIAKLEQGAYTIMPSSAETESFIGINAVEFLKKIEQKTDAKDVVPSENAEDRLFTGSLSGASNWDIEQQEDPFEYSSQFSFVQTNYNYTVSRHHIVQYHDFDERLFTDQLLGDLNTLSADEIIAKYGTHIIKEGYMGIAIHSQYRSIATSPTTSLFENAGYYFALLNDVNHQATEHQKLAISENYGTTTSVDFKGGDLDLMPRLTTEQNNKVIGSWNEAELTAWIESHTDTNLTLIKIGSGGLIPLYSIISDATLSDELKQATIKYIKSKQLDNISTTPLTLFQQPNGGTYHYNTARTDCIALGTLASLYNEQIAGTHPLYLHDTDKGERLSFMSNLSEDNASNNGVIGYCYKDQLNNRYDELKEITNGTQYVYVLNGNVEYSEEWTLTGNVIYTEKIDRL